MFFCQKVWTSAAEDPLVRKMSALNNPLPPDCVRLMDGGPLTQSKNILPAFNSFEKIKVLNVTL